MSGDFCLVLEDAAPAVQGDQIAGCSVEHAELAGDGLAALHRPVLSDSSLARAAAEALGRESPITTPLLAALLEGFAERYAGDVPEEHLEVCRRFVASYDGWAAHQLVARQGLVHGDYRLDNLLFGTADAARPLTVVDWQTVTWGAVMTDLAYFLGGSLRVADRRAHERRLVGRYCDALGVDGFTFDEAWEGYRRSAFLGILMAIVSPMLVARTERGDQMFLTVLERHVAQVLDLDCLDLLPAPATPAPLQPKPSDEHRHPAPPQPLWNESWYFDFVDVKQRVGGYIRLGLYPNEQNAWYTAVFCGPDRPTVSVIDFQAPLPASELTVSTPSYRADQEAAEPLNDYRVTLEGTADVDDTPAARLVETYEAGRTIEVSLDLAFLTDGAPYQYRLTPRYEIPCRVSGTLRIGAETIVLTDAPGQRDHSWGVRDWWSMDWIWSALHFEDASHVHALELRVPGQPPIGIGYFQQPGTDLVELTKVVVTETIGVDGLVAAAELALTPTDSTFTLTPRGHGPLRLVSGDGRVARFLRSWVEATAADGRRGCGWVEWNLAQQQAP